MSKTDYQNLVATTALNAGVDPVLALAVAQQESGFNPGAVSPEGAIGIMQLMPGTAAGLGVNPYDPAENVQGGVNFLSQLLAQFGGDQAKALAAYNWGPARVQNAVAQYGHAWLEHAPSETRNYVASIMASAGSAGPAVVSSSSDGSGSEIAPAEATIAAGLASPASKVGGTLAVLGAIAFAAWAVA